MHRVLLAITSLSATVLLLRAFPPELFSFYPACPFHVLTGLLCPGCGGTRALAELAAGHVSAAFLHNSFVTVSTPVLAARILWAHCRLQTCVVPPSAAPYLLAAVAIYGVLRNIVFL